MMRVDFMSFQQPIGLVHVTKLSGKLLYRVCKADIRRMNEHLDYIGIERDLINSRLPEIKSYIDTVYATFPNNVVLNVDTSKDNVYVDYENKQLVFDVTEDIFEILDGQHRINAFNKSKEDFEIPVAFFVDLDDSSKAIIFNNINFEQRPVSSSLSFELESLFPVYTPEKMLRNIVDKLNKSKKSPYYRKIKMRGVTDESQDDGVISLSSLVRVMLTKTYLKSKKHLLRDYLLQAEREFFDTNIDTDFSNKLHTKNHFLWDYYYYNHEETLFVILQNFFNAVRKTFKIDWNPNGLLMKSIGFKALFGLFESVYYSGRIDGKLSEEYFFDKLRPLQQLDGKINSRYYGSSFSEASKIEKLLKSKLK